MNSIQRMTMVVIILAMTASGFAGGVHEGDVIIVMEGGQLITGTEGDGGFTPNSLWIEDIDKGIVDHPGYDAESGTLAPGATVGLAIRKALRAWNYDEAHFLTIPLETMTVTRFALSMETPSQDPEPGEFPSLLLGVASGGGSLHVHPVYELMPPAADGIYLLELEFWTNAGGMITSEPFWIMFTKNEEDEEVVHDAEDWVFDNLIDTVEPGCPADLIGSGNVGVPDLLQLLGCWGAIAPGCEAADLTGSGSVGVSDLLELLAQWGPCE